MTMTQEQRTAIESLGIPIRRQRPDELVGRHAQPMTVELAEPPAERTAALNATVAGIAAADYEIRTAMADATEYDRRAQGARDAARSARARLHAAQKRNAALAAELVHDFAAAATS